MRIVSYNILDGGEGRADPLAEVIEAQRPDLVALVEADVPEVVDRIANRLKMDHIRAVGKKHASALLSRWPILETINHGHLQPKLRSSCLEALVRWPSGEEWAIGVVHLHPHATDADETIREEEVGVILDLFARHRDANRPHLLCGDFNSNAPAQSIDPAACKPRTQKDWDENGGKVPRRVVRKLLDAGYVDSLQAARPALASNTGTFSTQYPGQRVDYIFTFGVGAERLVDAWAEHDRLAKYASDHFPVGVEFK